MKTQAAILYRVWAIRQQAEVLFLCSHGGSSVFKKVLACILRLVNAVPQNSAR